MNPVFNPPDASPKPASFSLETTLGFQDIKDCLPPILAKLACKSQQLMGVASETCAATGLAHLAASYGRYIVIDDGISRRAPTINFLAVSNQPASSDWMVFLGRGWTDVARRATGIDLAELISQLNETKRDPARPKGAQAVKQPPSPNNAVKPVTVLTSSVSPAEVGRLLQQSPDACLTILNSIDDPLEEWSRLVAMDQRRLFTMLRESWCGRSVHTTLKDDETLEATLGCLWSTHQASATRTFFRSGNSLQDNLPPLLLHQVRGNPLCYPDCDAPEVQEWNQLLHERFATRSKKTVDIALVFRAEAEKFARDVRTEINNQPALYRPWLGWTCDLLPKIFTLLWSEYIHMWEKQKKDRVAEYHSQLGEDASVRFADIETQHIHAQVEAAIPKNKVSYILPKALRLTTWLIQEHHAALKALASAPTEPQPADNPDNPDKGSLSEAILGRLRDKGPMLPRKIQRSFRKVTAKERDEAVEILKSRGLVTQSKDGKLCLTH
jgi:hypothetical protein